MPMIINWLVDTSEIDRDTRNNVQVSNVVQAVFLLFVG